jgi:arylamine N-acetyltransferase
VKAYLRRIDYRRPLGPDVESLRGLHRAHMFTVPFENLDILLGRPESHTSRATPSAPWPRRTVA